MAKACKKAKGGEVDMGSKLVDQHRRMATGHMGSVNKQSMVEAKGGRVSKGKKK